jgi:hypothetical protein
MHISTSRRPSHRRQTIIGSWSFLPISVQEMTSIRGTLQRCRVLLEIFNHYMDEAEKSSMERHWCMSQCVKIGDTSFLDLHVA